MYAFYVDSTAESSLSAADVLALYNDIVFNFFFWVLVLWSSGGGGMGGRVGGFLASSVVCEQGWSGWV